MTEHGFDLLPGEHPIVPVMLGDEVAAARLSRNARRARRLRRAASRIPSFHAAPLASAPRCPQRTISDELDFAVAAILAGS